MSANLPLVVHVVYALSTGGLENGLVNIINRSPVNRYRHVIVCITKADHFAQRITAPGVQVFELGKREGHDLRFYWQLWKLFRELRPDIIHSRNLAALESQLFSLGCPGVKRVHGEHGRELNDLDGNNWKYLSFKRFMRVFINRYIAVSKDLEQWLVRKVGVAPTKVRQIYNGVDHGLFSPDTVKSRNLLPTHWHVDESTLLIGTVGRLTPVKDQQNLLQALACLRESHPALFAKLRLLIVGDGPLRSNLSEKISELKLGEMASLMGDRDDVPALLRNMDVFVLPSLAEGISNTVLEAMACGLPVVATEVGGNRELVTEGFNGFLVPPNDPAALARALSSILSNESERLTLGENARQWVGQNFDWKRTVESYLGVYDELLHIPVVKNIRSAG